MRKAAHQIGTQLAGTACRHRRAAALRIVGRATDCMRGLVAVIALAAVLGLAIATNGPARAQEGPAAAQNEPAPAQDDSAPVQDETAPVENINEQAMPAPPSAAGQPVEPEPEQAQSNVPEPGQSMAVDYKLSSQDKIRVMVYEWRPALDEIFAWSALNQEYTIGPTGNLSLPLIGEIRAAGNTTAGLAQLIGTQLRDRMGLASAPDTAVEVVQFRPFYVTGHVQKPGEYPYRPGLTALQAISISGGMIRRADATAMRLERDSMVARGEIQLLAKERDTLLARKARLQAELVNAAEINFPAELVGRADDSDPATALLLTQERQVFKARKQSYETQMTVLRQLKEYLDKELVTLSGQLDAHRKQMSLLKIELDGVRTLAKKGLTTAPRRLALERNFAQLEGDDLRINGELLKIRQEISRTEISMVELENKWSGEATARLQEVQQELEKVETKTNTTGKLLYEAEVVAPLGMVVSGSRKKLEPTLTVVRLVNGKLTELPADEMSPINPGDTLKIEFPVPDLVAPMMPFSQGATGTNAVPTPADDVSPKRAALE
jgi:protein involved in polysaccharide export with SLBB domain